MVAWLLLAALAPPPARWECTYPGFNGTPPVHMKYEIIGGDLVENAGSFGLGLTVHIEHYYIEIGASGIIVATQTIKEGDTPISKVVTINPAQGDYARYVIGLPTARAVGSCRPLR